MNDYIYKDLEENLEQFENHLPDAKALQPGYKQEYDQAAAPATLNIPDIRNKLSPITHLISIIENEKFNNDKFLRKALDRAKTSINYLAQRDVYSS